MLMIISRRKCFALLIAAALLGTGPASTLAGAPAPKASQARFEVRFLTDMIDHHAMAVMMAELCPGRAFHEPLLGLCEEIMVTQSAQIEMMQSWLEQWYGISYQPEMTPGDAKMIEGLSELAGEEFEIEFLEMMIRHHKKAIKEASDCLKKTYHEELLQLCSEITQAQSEEIAMMERWLCEWYSVCR